MRMGRFQFDTLSDPRKQIILDYSSLDFISDKRFFCFPLQYAPWIFVPMTLSLLLSQLLLTVYSSNNSTTAVVDPAAHRCER